MKTSQWRKWCNNNYGNENLDKSKNHMSNPHTFIAATLWDRKELSQVIAYHRSLTTSRLILMIISDSLLNTHVVVVVTLRYQLDYIS